MTSTRTRHPNDLLPDDLRGVPTYAFPVYEIAAELMLLAVLWLARDRLRERPGTAFLITAIGYAVIRFVLTYLRQEPVLAYGLQEAQVVALATGVLAASVLLWRLARQVQGVARSPIQ
jgi:phosphatidylglycerol:prolipoprotein diacylglycerol transferase